MRADAVVDKASEDSSTQNTLVELIRQYAVYAMCSSPTLIDWAPSILETLTSIPIIKQITEAIVSQTFFLQVRPLRPGHSSEYDPIAVRGRADYR